MSRTKAGRRTLPLIVLLACFGAPAWAQDVTNPPPPAASSATGDSRTEEERQASVCLAASQERDKLIAAGVQALVEQGPEWARANSSDPRLAEVRRFLALQEVLLFRCPVDTPRLVLASEAPPLPVRRPPGVQKTKRRPRPRRLLVPLPVRKSSVL